MSRAGDRMTEHEHTHGHAHACRTSKEPRP